MTGNSVEMATDVAVGVCEEGSQAVCSCQIISVLWQHRL